MIRLKDLLFEIVVDEVEVSKKDGLVSNAKAVWDMYDKNPNEEEIAEKLGINLPTVQKIVKICLMKFADDKITTQKIADEMKLSSMSINRILNNAIPDWEREIDIHFTKDADEIYNLHKQGKSPEEIVNLINQNREPHLQIKLDKVNLVLKIVDIATKQMENDGVINTREIGRQTNVGDTTIAKLVKRLGIGEIRYQHKFTPEQDAFILSKYLERKGGTEISRQFNEKFSTESNKLNITGTSIRFRLKRIILKSNSESEISEYALKLIRDYKDEYFPTVDINNAYTKELLTHYTAPERIKGKDPLARKGGKVNPTRPISNKPGNLEPDIKQTFTTGTSPGSGQLGKKLGAPLNTQGASNALEENTKQFKKINGNTFTLNS